MTLGEDNLSQQYQIGAYSVTIYPNDLATQVVDITDTC